MALLALMVVCEPGNKVLSGQPVLGYSCDSPEVFGDLNAP
jgi:hypothetical protein